MERASERKESTKRDRMQARKRRREKAREEEWFKRSLVQRCCCGSHWTESAAGTVAIRGGSEGRQALRRRRHKLVSLARTLAPSPVAAAGAAIEAGSSRSLLRRLKPASALLAPSPSLSPLSSSDSHSPSNSLAVSCTPLAACSCRTTV